ncbi:unnamed protein product [Hermetia illucens]|uniref:Ionotropic glutamate receptor C-terminal domain-containing protein n=1 Tax=Hermetia illucens TaxID=343691 RepID=A0A7R8YM41_HERIL|nr:uncharacterized protein LOC119646949 [Hermetia illucens]CAD7077082.1 unnamed protein product [Hermetia illucens]
MASIQLVTILSLLATSQAWNFQEVHTRNILDSKANFEDFLMNRTRDIVCALEVHVIHLYFDPCYLRGLADDAIKILSECKSAPLFVRTVGETHRYREIHFVSVHVFIIKQANIENILKSTNSVEKCTRRKMLLRYIFTFFDNTVTSEEVSRLAMYLFKTLWRKQVLNAVAVFKTNTIEVLGYDPFSARGNITIVNLTNVEYKALFQNNVRNLNGLPIRIAMFDDPVRSVPRKDGLGYDGADGYIARTIIDHLNASVQYIYPKDADIYGTYNSGALGDVAAGRADIGFNARYVTLEDASYVEQTNSFERVDLCVVVPKAKRMSMVCSIFNTLSVCAWIAWVAIFCLTIGFFYAIQEIEKKVKNRQAKDVYSFTEIVLLLFQLFFGDALIRLSRLITLRYMLLSWLIFSLLVTSMFVGKLVSSLVLVRYEEDIDHLSELANSSLELGVAFPLLKPMKVALDDHTWNTLEPKIRRLNMDYFDYLRYRPRNSAYVLRTDKAKYFLAQTYDQNAGRPTYHIMDEIVVFEARVYIVTVGSALLGKINSLLSSFYESGLIQYWEGMAEYQAVISGLLVRDEDAYKYGERDHVPDREAEPKVVLSLEHLQCTFYMWFFGIILSVLAFMGEHLYWWWHQRQMARHDSLDILFDGYLP